MYLNTDALPIAKAMPIVNISAVNDHGPSPMLIDFGPPTVCRVTVVGGYDRKKRHTRPIHSTHHVTACAPYLSENQPPTARRTPPGMLKHAASSAASRMSN